MRPSCRDGLQAAKAFLAGAAELINSASFCLARGDAALAAKDYTSAESYFRRAIGLDASNTDALGALTVALAMQERFAEAVPVYRQILALQPTDRVSRYNLAVAHQRLGEWAQAEMQYRQLLTDELADSRVWFNLAVSLQMQGKLASARDALKRTIELEADNPEAHAFLGEVLMDLNEPAQAAASFAKAANLQPKTVGHWANLAVAYRTDGSLGLAMATYQRALGLAPQDAALWRELGSTRLEAHRASGQVSLLADALEAWRKSLQLDHNQPEVARWIEAHSLPSATTRP